MSNTKSDDNDPAGYLIEMAKHQGGVACATVKDGHILLFSKEALQRLVTQCDEKGNDKVIVFVKRADMAPGKPLGGLS